MSKALLSCICLLQAINSFGQTKTSLPRQLVTLDCTYRLIFRPDSTSTNQAVEKMQLLISGNISEFKSSNISVRDSLKRAAILKGNEMGVNDPNLGQVISSMLKGPKPKFNYTVYKIINTNECIVYDNILLEKYNYNEENYPLKWKLVDTTSVIAGYKCQMARTAFAGRRYIAWFTREIPVSDGPYKFSGLPGLIIKINDYTNSYNFELISLTKPAKSLFVGLPVEPTLTTTKGIFFRASRAARENAVSSASQFGVTFKNPEVAQQQLAERLKHANNPLELNY